MKDMVFLAYFLLCFLFFFFFNKVISHSRNAIEHFVFVGLIVTTSCSLKVCFFICMCGWLNNGPEMSMS